MNKKISSLIRYLFAFTFVLSIFSISSILADEVVSAGRQLSCLRTGESLLPGDSIVLEGDGEEWDRIMLVLEEHEFALYLYVKGQKIRVWTAYNGFPTKFKSATLNSEGYFISVGDTTVFIPEGKRVVVLENRLIAYIEGLPVLEDLYLVVEKTLNSARIAIYNSSNELVWESENSKFKVHSLC